MTTDTTLRALGTTGTAAPPGPTARTRLILFVLCAAQFMIALDFSILNVALPVLGRELHMSQANLQWAVTAFALPSGGFLLLFGRVADLFGRRRLFLTGLALFTAASALATLAWGPGVFLAARAVQGLGAAVIVPTGMSLLTTTFPEGPQRDRALGVSGTLMSLGFTIGVVLGGVLTDTLGWRSTMGLLGVAGVIVLVVAPGVLAESRNPARPRLDVPGAVTVTGGLLAVIYALSTAAQRGFGSADVVATLVVGAVLLAAFVVVESRVAEPMVSLRMLRLPTVAFGNLAGVTTFAMMSTVVFLLTLYLQDVRGLTALRTGLVFGVQGLGAAVTGMTAARVVARIGPHRLLVGGLLIQAVLTATMVFLGTGSGGTWLALATVTAGCVGHMWAIVSYGITATSGLPDHQQGLATGLVTSSQQVGMTIGIPLLGALATTRAHLLGGVRLALGVDAAVVAVVAVLVAVGLARRARR
ncbi:MULTISPECIES: MFS transporter [Streptomycetaceae]|uniref:Transmembrane efflux protein n=1 Tax=Streptantibioticus cattleyicolor (strain ATCC 35852 / DSM 46488 / JCM 4925 / NBRC 14057 / NRRL 8057) TaxID=1003195 RepID=F8JP16_STREN|nr:MULTISPECIES: MFS transporter [Streptomycetaceae]AEW93958.1 transmembrane efflux protein [Streptantibioticus cattleyicolor NRRL 8057 = DSM 46488]MYS58634.1 MFS transporter [Streptomyces sp. SID5468]CCB74304.1 putative transmembrane efflux protein [Streptantibioticus cattleyicolor NRRL 8057 = DSM 46488]